MKKQMPLASRERRLDKARICATRHTFRHVEEAGIDTQAAENAIRNDLAGKGASLPQGRTTGQVYVQGRVLQYNAYKFLDGTINVGRITVH